MKMTLKQYHIKKKEHQIELEKEYGQHRNSCLRCFRPIKSCFCQSIKPFPTKTQIIILMHPMEAKEKVGTGRLAHLCLKNSNIIVGINFKENLKVQHILNDPEVFPVILYPGEKSHNISKGPLKGFNPNKKKLTVFVIDATWAHAKIIMRENTQFHHRPWISFDSSNTSKFTIKHQPSKLCLSTIESIYYLLQGCGVQGYEDLKQSEEELLKTLQKLVDFQIACAQNPDLSSYRKGHYKSPEKRSSSKKWKSRAICFDRKNYHNQEGT